MEAKEVELKIQEIIDSNIAPIKMVFDITLDFKSVSICIAMSLN